MSWCLTELFLANSKDIRLWYRNSCDYIVAVEWSSRWLRWQWGWASAEWLVRAHFGPALVSVGISAHFIYRRILLGLLFPTFWDIFIYFTHSWTLKFMAQMLFRNTSLQTLKQLLRMRFYGRGRVKKKLNFTLLLLYFKFSLRTGITDRTRK